MSIPSSRLLVATSAGSRPAFSSSSMIVRCSRARLPWWARATSSSASSLRRRARRSASRRLLTKISVERWARISSSSSGYMAGQIDRRRFSPPATSLRLSGAERSPPSSRMSSTGTTTSISSSLAEPASTTVTGRGRPSPSWPPRKRAISASGRWVADRPMRCRAPPSSATTRSSRSRLSDEVGAALGPGHGVDLVDDHRADAGQHLRPARGEQQVQALGGGDQDVRRACAASAGARAGGCRRCAPPPRSRAPRRPSGRRPPRCPASGPRRLRSTS